MVDEPGDLIGELLGPVMVDPQPNLLPEPHPQVGLLGAYLDRNQQVGRRDASLGRCDQGRLNRQQTHPMLQAKRKDPLPEDSPGGRVSERPQKSVVHGVSQSPCRARVNQAGVTPSKSTAVILYFTKSLELPTSSTLVTMPVKVLLAVPDV